MARQDPSGGMFLAPLRLLEKQVVKNERLLDARKVMIVNGLWCWLLGGGVGGETRRMLPIPPMPVCVYGDFLLGRRGSTSWRVVRIFGLLAFDGRDWGLDL